MTTAFGKKKPDMPINGQLKGSESTFALASSVLTINGGSSSIRFAVYEAGEPLRRRLVGKVDRIGLSGTTFSFNDASGKYHQR